MALNIDDELNLPLSEFVKLPTTVDFQVLNTERFKIFARSRPYIRLGTEFENRYIVGYINQAYVSQLVNDLGGDFLYFLPRIMSPTDSQSNDASGITRVLNQPLQKSWEFGIKPLMEKDSMIYTLAPHIQVTILITPIALQIPTALCRRWMRMVTERFWPLWRQVMNQANILVRHPKHIYSLSN